MSPSQRSERQGVHRLKLVAAANGHIVVAYEVRAHATGAANGSHACLTAAITSNTCTMKTAISLPDELFHEIDACARELKTSRSRVLARAARDFLERHQQPAAPTAAWNRAIARAGQPGEDRAARAFRRRGKAVIRARTP